MELDHQMLQQLMNMNDEALRASIERVAQAAGASESQIKRMTGNMRDVRRRLSRVSERDLHQISETLDPSLLEEIRRAANGNCQKDGR